jgi:3',5'-cyclic AMP phosphodiesterase CpdA
LGAIGIAAVLAACGGGGGLPEPAVTLVAAGDIAQCSGKPPAQSAAARTAALVAQQDAVVLTLGDNAYEDGTPDEFANCFDPTWGAFKYRIRPAIGNHDARTPGVAGYFGYFGSAAGPAPLGYYSFDHGGWHIVVLNSEIDVSATSEQYRWLTADLAASKARCTIAVSHRPRFNSGADYGSLPEMGPVFDALYQAGVELLLSGHEHVYERFAPQKGDGTSAATRGVRQFVVGTGGHVLNQFGATARNSDFRFNADWGVLRLTLGANEYSWQFLSVGGGAPLDAGSGSCH